MFHPVIQVALGGAVGSVARYLTVLAAARLFGPGLPWGTLAVNVSGSLVMGALFVWLSARGPAQLSPLLLTGILGGYTTFSAFSLDTVQLWQDGASGTALVYVVASVGLSVAALIAGMALAKGLMA